MQTLITTQSTYIQKMLTVRPGWNAKRVRQAARREIVSALETRGYDEVIIRCIVKDANDMVRLEQIVRDLDEDDDDLNISPNVSATNDMNRSSGV